MQNAIIYVAWDETGEFAAHTEADDAADLLEEKSAGKFRRVVALRLTLPSAGPVELDVIVPDAKEPVSVSKI